MKRQLQVVFMVTSAVARRMLVVVMAALLAACSLVSVNDTSHYTDAEGRIPEDLLAEIQPRKTTKAWIYAHFGEPMSVADVATGQEVFTYPLTRVHRKDLTLLFLIRYRGVERATEYFHVAFEDDFVAQHWIDELPLVQKAPVAEAP